MQEKTYRAPFTGKIETAEDIGLKDQALCARLDDWIRRNLRPRNTINTRYTNYGLKHLAEQDLGCYIHQMLMHEILLHVGYRSRWKLFSPNYHYNIASDSPCLK